MSSDLVVSRLSSSPRPTGDHASSPMADTSVGPATCGSSTRREDWPSCWSVVRCPRRGRVTAAAAAAARTPGTRDAKTYASSLVRPAPEDARSRWRRTKKKVGSSVEAFGTA